MTWFRSEQNSRQTRPKQRVLAITLITGFGKIIKILNHDVYLVSNRTENVLSQMTVTGPDKQRFLSQSRHSALRPEKTKHEPLLHFGFFISDTFTNSFCEKQSSDSLHNSNDFQSVDSCTAHTMNVSVLLQGKKKSIFSEVNHFATQF